MEQIKLILLILNQARGITRMNSNSLIPVWRFSGEVEVGSLAEANNEFITPLFPDSVVSLQDPLVHLLASTKKEVL